MGLFNQIRKTCIRCGCRACPLHKDNQCLLNRPPEEWNKDEIKRALRKEK